MKRVFYLKPGDQIRIMDSLLLIKGKDQHGFQVTEYPIPFEEDGALMFEFDKDGYLMIAQEVTNEKSYSITRHDLQYEVYRYTGHVYSFFWYTEDPDYNEDAEEGVPFQ